MASYTLRRFSCPEALRTIGPASFLAFLEPYRPFFLSRGVTLPLAGANEDLDYTNLVQVFMTPNTRTPKDLIDALYFVDEMATQDGMDALLAEATAHGLELADGTDHTPADIAVQVWLLDRNIVERQHAQRHMARVRSFESYHVDGRQPLTLRRPGTTQLVSLANELDGWFEDRKRGRGSKVLMFDRAEEIWSLVRHGETFKREESLDGAVASSVCYRPLKYDVVVYTPGDKELRINARSKGEKELYRTKFGKYLFGDSDAFSGTAQYTLAPLRELEEGALAVGDIEGIDWVRLKEVQFFFSGDPWEIVIRKAEDVFAVFKSRGTPFPKNGRILQASFQIKFGDAKTPRSVVIKPPIIAQYARDDDCLLVENWLKARGFIVNPELEVDE